MSGIAKEDLVRMYADPFCTQSPRNESSNGRGEHSDNNQINPAADLECTSRYARIAPRGYGRKAHAGTECKENEGQSKQQQLRLQSLPMIPWGFLQKGWKFQLFQKPSLLPVG